MIHERPVWAEPRARCFRCREESEDGKTQRKKVSSGLLLSYLQFRDRVNINDQKAGGGGGGSREAQALLVPDENPGLADHCGGLFGAGESMGLELLMSFSVGAGRVFLPCLEGKNQELSSRPRGGPRVELGLAPDSELSEDALQHPQMEQNSSASSLGKAWRRGALSAPHPLSLWPLWFQYHGAAWLPSL